MRRSPTLTGATKSRWSMEAVTVTARAWRLAAMAPVRSMNCMRRPPKRLPRALVSPGKMISERSDWESATGRAFSDIETFYVVGVGGVLLRDERQKQQP